MLELAPYGSLAAVLEELSTKREERGQSQETCVVKSRDPILGRELSYKIAFQVNL